MVQITSAGAGSGMDMESIISALISEKSTQLTRQTKTRRNNTEIELSGVSTLKSRLSSFKSSLEKIDEESEYNARKITDDQNEAGVFTVTAKDDASNMDFSLKVTQLASAEKITQTLDRSSMENKFEAGTITLDLGTDEEGNSLGSYTVDVQDGDTLESIRKKINKNDIGITANLISSENGYTLSFSNTKTGAGTTQMSITTTVNTDNASTEARDSLSIFNFSSAASDDGAGNQVQAGLNGWTHTAGKDAVIEVDGQELRSKTNVFDKNQVAGVTISVNKLSETESTVDENGNTVTGLKAYNVSLTSDTDAVSGKISTFVSDFNALMTSLTKLSKRNTYTDGKSNEDGGDLAGDASVTGIKSMLTKMVVNNSETSGGMTIFDMGLSYEKDGTLSLDASKLKTALEENYNGVVELFTGENGLITEMKDYVTGYTKSAGVLDKRTENLNLTLKTIEAQEDRNASILESYSTSVRNRYGNLDSLMASYNASMSYLSSVIGSIGTS